VVRYLGAYPVLVDCDAETGNMDLVDAERKTQDCLRGALSGLTDSTPVVGIMPVHVGGLMMDVTAIRTFADRHGLWIVEDAAHAFPAAWRPNSTEPWQICGENTATVTCYSFYANKTITTGEGGMAVCSDPELAQRIRMMSLHGLSRDAWGRYTAGGNWDYRIIAPGFKYNLPDALAALGVVQLSKAEKLRAQRERLACEYFGALADLQELLLPPTNEDRLHSWHLFPIRLQLDRLRIDRNQFIDELKQSGVGCSVHWRPLHRHPYYEETFGWAASDCPVAAAVWETLISLPLFPGMTTDEHAKVVETVRGICARFAA
jgi:perosamine synthetase